MMTELKRQVETSCGTLRSSHWKNCAADTSSIEMYLHLHFLRRVF